jgi:hypothetical protein
MSAPNGSKADEKQLVVRQIRELRARQWPLACNVVRQLPLLVGCERLFHTAIVSDVFSKRALAVSELTVNKRDDAIRVRLFCAHSM